MKLRNIKMLYKKPELVFLLIAVPFGILSALLIPQISVTDEDSHFLRAYQVSRGEYICPTSTTYPEDIVDKSKTGAGGSREYNADYSDVVTDSGDKKYACGSARNYSPVSYIPQATGILIAENTYPSAALMVLFGRLLNLLAYVGIIYYVIKRVSLGKYVFFVIGLTPQLIHLAASLSPDALNNAITFAIIGITFNLYTQRSKITKKQIVALITLSATSAILKQTLFLLFLPLLFLPARVFIKNKTKRLRFNIHKYAVGTACLIAAATSFIVWSRFTQIPGSDVMTRSYDELSNPLDFIKLLYNTYLSDYGDLVLRGVFGEFSSFLFHFPTILVMTQAVLIILAGFAVYGAKKVVLPKLGLVLASTATFILSILVITYGLYTEWALKNGITLYADGVQGRYFTALLLLLIPLMAWLRQYISIVVRSKGVLFSILASGQVLLLSYYLFLLLRLLKEMY